MGRTIRANVKVTTAVVALPDQFSRQAASLGIMTNTFSPGAAGIHQAGASARGFVGDRGYGVNRWAGRTQDPVQWLGQVTAPIKTPASQRVGFGAGVSGQPGLPSTGDQTGGLAQMFGPLGRAGWGS